MRALIQIAISRQISENKSSRNTTFFQSRKSSLLFSIVSALVKSCYYITYWFSQFSLFIVTTIKSPDNVEERNFLSFCMPSNIQLEDKGEFSAWCDRMIFIFEDLKWLLSLPVPQFWNQVRCISVCKQTMLLKHSFDVHQIILKGYQTWCVNNHTTLF